MVYIGSVHHHINGNLRIIRRSKTDKGNNVLRLGTLVGILVNGFRRSRFSSDHVTGRTSRMACALPHYRLAVLPDPFGSGFGYHLFQHPWFNVGHGSAVGIRDLIYHMGFVIISPVNQSAKSGNHLNHGNIKILPERISGKVGGAYLIRRINQAGCTGFSGKVNIRF